jgi:hypothetical protein
MNLNLFSTKIDVAAASMAELVTFYNATTGKAIKKFETRAIGILRCTVLLKDETTPAPTGIDPIEAPRAEVKKLANATNSAVKAARRPSKGNRLVLDLFGEGSMLKVVKPATNSKSRKASKTAPTAVAKKPQKRSLDAFYKVKQGVTERAGVYGEVLAVALKLVKFNKPQLEAACKHIKFRNERQFDNTFSFARANKVFLNTAKG